MKLLLLCIISVATLVVFKSSTQDPLQKSIERGSEIYRDFCVSCHMSNGEGIKNTYPPLAKSDYLIKNRTGSIKAIKYGLEGDIIVNGVTYNGYMAAQGLADDEIADVMNYITNAWGNKTDKIITEEEVAMVEK